MKFELFDKLYKSAKTYESIDGYINIWEDESEIKSQYDNIVLLLRFIYDIAHMGIREIREYLGMTRPMFCERYELKIRTLEDWEYGKNPVPERFLKLLSYTLIADFMG